MVLVNVIAFAVFETLYNLVSMQKSLFAKITAEVSKTTKSVLYDLTFIFSGFQVQLTILWKRV